MNTTPEKEITRMSYKEFDEKKGKICSQALELEAEMKNLLAAREAEIKAYRERRDALFNGGTTEEMMEVRQLCWEIEAMSRAVIDIEKALCAMRTVRDRVEAVDYGWRSY